MNNGYKYMLRFVLVPDVAVDERIEELVQFCKKTEIDEVVFFICAEDYNTGHVTIEEAKPFIDAILKAKAKLLPLNIKTSINPWITLNHSDRGRKLKEGQNFDTMVGSNGYKATTVACPTSKGWKKYYKEYLKFICDTVNPDTVWIEDDLRFSNHELKDDVIGCFCDEHLKLYANELGVKYVTREDFVDGLLNNKKGYRRAYRDANEKVIKDLLAEIREYIGNPNVRLGTMAGTPMAKYFEGGSLRMMMDTLKSEKRDSIFRAHVALYRQQSPQAFAYRFSSSILPGRAFLDDNAEVVSEIENYPCTRYCKSAKGTAYTMLMTAPLMMQGATFSIFEYCGNGVTDADLFAKELKNVKPFLSKMNSLNLKHSGMKGISTFISKNSCNYITNVKNLNQLEYTDNYVGGVLGSMGITITFTDELEKAKDVLILSQLTVRELSEEQLKEVFAKRFIILGALAAEELIKKGLGSLIKAKSIKRLKERTGDYSYEAAHMELNSRIPKERAAMQYFVGDFGKVEYDGEVTPLTKVYNYDNSFVAEGITLINGNVLILPFYYTAESLDLGYPCGLLHPMRRRAIKKAIVDIAKIKDVVFAGTDMVLPYLYSKDDADYIILNNFIDDAVDKIEFYTANDYKKISIVTVEDTEFKSVNFENNGGKYTLDASMGASTSVILRLE